MPVRPRPVRWILGAGPADAGPGVGILGAGPAGAGPGTGLGDFRGLSGEPLRRGPDRGPDWGILGAGPGGRSGGPVRGPDRGILGAGPAGAGPADLRGRFGGPGFYALSNLRPVPVNETVEPCRLIS